MKERWKNIKSFPHYQISDRGSVVNVRLGHRLHPYFDKRGYGLVTLSDGESKTLSVQKLVAEAFIGPRPKGMVIYFKDGDSTNCRVSNLEYRRRGSHPHSQGARHYKAKLKAADVRKIRRRYKRRKVTLEDLSDEFGVTKQCVHDIIMRRTWKHLEG